MEERKGASRSEILSQAVDGAAIRVASDYAQSDLTRGQHGQRGGRRSAERKGGGNEGNGHRGRWKGEGMGS